MCIRDRDEDVDENILKKLANIISWNLWQMDGLTDNVPFGAPAGEPSQMSFLEEREEKESEPVACRIFDWKANKSQTFVSMKENI